MKGDRRKLVIAAMTKLRVFTARQLADESDTSVKNISNYLMYGQRQSLLSLNKQTRVYTVLPSANLNNLIVSKSKNHRKPKVIFDSKLQQMIKDIQGYTYKTQAEQAIEMARIQAEFYAASKGSKTVLPPLPSIDLEDLKVRVTSLPEYVKHLEDGWIKERKDHADLRCWVDRTLRKMPDPCQYRLPMEAKL